MSKTHQDFDLFLERRKPNEFTSYTLDKAGQRIAEHDFTLRVDTLKMRENLQRLEAYALSSELVKDDFHMRFGRILYEAALGGDVGSLFVEQLKMARARRQGLRIRVRIAEDAAELSALPWELLCDGNIFLATQYWTPISRLPPGVEKTSYLPLKSTLRMLVVVSNPRNLPDYRVLNTEREQEMILEALDRLQMQGKLRIDWGEEASLKTIQDYLAEGDTHILHFTGHGIFDEERDEGFLLLENERGHAEEVSNEKVARLLSTYPSLRLVVLSACQSAKRSRSPGFLGLAQRLLVQGVPTVLAMQYSVRDDRATEFTRRFYGSLAAGKDVDVALTEARVDLSMEGVDFATPILYMSDPKAVSIRQLAPEKESIASQRKLMMWGTVPRIEKGFVGRQQELRRIREGFLRGQQRAFIIYGFGGIGKSVLATRAATKMAQHFVGVKAIRCTATTRPENILSELNTFLNLLGINSYNKVIHAQMPLEAKTDILCNILNQVRCLVIFDNFEECLNDEHDIADPALARFMAQVLCSLAEGSKFLITTRYDFEPLGGQGRLTGQIGHISLGELSFPMAVQLMNNFDVLAHLPLGARGQELRVRGAYIGISKRKVYDKIGGHPYAIGAFARQAEVSGVDGLLLELEAVEREMIEFTLLEQIFSQLTPQAQRLLKRASVYEDPVPLDGLIWVIGPSTIGPSLGDSLHELMAWGLIVAETAKEDAILFTLHALVRDFARRRLSEEEAKEALFGAAGFYFEEVVLDTSDDLKNIMESVGKDDERKVGQQLFQLYDRALAKRPERVWDWLRARHYFAKAGQHEMSSNIVMVTFHYLLRWGYVELAMSLLNEVFDISDDESERAHAGTYLAMIYEHLGDYDTSIRLYENALATYESQGYERAIAAVLNNLGMAYSSQGDYDKALEAFHRSLATKLEIGDKHGAINSLANISSIYKHQGEYARSLFELARAMEIANELEDDSSSALLSGNLGAIFVEIGESMVAGSGYDPSKIEALAAARHAFESCLETYRRVGDRRGISTTLLNLGNLYRLTGNIRVAQKMFEDCLHIVLEIGDRPGVAHCLMGLATIHEADGELATAQEKLEQALEISREVGNQRLVAYSHFGIGKMLEKQGRIAEAREQYANGLGISTELGLSIVGELQLALMRVRWKLGFQSLKSMFRRIFSLGGYKQ